MRLDRLLLVLAFSTACAPKIEPAAPAPDARAADPAPPRPKSLAVSLEQEPSLRVHLRVDGEPVRGTIALVPLAAGKMSSAPGTPDDSAVYEDRVALEAHDGVVEVPSSVTDILAERGAFDLVVGGLRFPLVLPAGTNPFQCARSLDALRSLDACTVPIPKDEAVPVFCDDAGAGAWRAIGASKREAFASCWRKIDEATVAKLESVRDETIRHAACERLAASLAAQPSEEDAIRVVLRCERELPRPVAEPALKKRRARDLPAAYEAAKRGSTYDMQRFHDDYAITGDPRVEEIRALAAEKFGPKDGKRFARARKMIATMRFGGWSAQLCDLQDGVATVAILPRWEGSVERKRSSARAAVDDGGDRRTCRVIMRRRVPEATRQAVRSAAAAATGAKTVEVTTHCSSDYWFFDVPRR